VVFTGNIWQLTVVFVVSTAFVVFSSGFVAFNGVF
jgi:hypothetical protein